MTAGNRQHVEGRGSGVLGRSVLVVDHLWWRGSEHNFWLASAACLEPILETSFLLVAIKQSTQRSVRRATSDALRCKRINHRSRSTVGTTLKRFVFEKEEGIEDRIPA